MGLKVGLKQLSNAGHATGPSTRGSLGPGTRKDKSRHIPTSKVSRSVLCCSTSPPPLTCPPTGHQPPTITMGQHTAIPFRMAEGRSQSPGLQPLPPQHHPPVPVQRHPSLWAPAQEATRVGPPWPAPPPAPKEPASPPLQAGPSGEEVPAPTPPPSSGPIPARSPPPALSTSSIALAAAAEKASSGPCNCFT